MPITLVDKFAAAFTLSSNEIKYSPALDGLRAVCILFTLFNHVADVPRYINGSAGVDVFFPLSGFLITAIMLRSTWADLKGYFIRRFFRIAPVYYLSLGVTVMLALSSQWLTPGESRFDQLSNIILPSLFLSRELASAPTLFGQAWTVGIEEKFYIAWPIIVLLLRHSLVSIAFLIAVLIVVGASGNPTMLRGYGGVALGCLAGLLYFCFGFRVKTSYAALALTIAYLFCICSDAWYRNITIDFAAALLIPSIFSTHSVISRALSYPPVVFAGKLTFSIYMFHVLVFFFVKMFLRHFGAEYWPLVFFTGYMLTLVCASIIYRFYEAPLIKYGRTLAGRGRKQQSRDSMPMANPIDHQAGEPEGVSRR